MVTPVDHLENLGSQKTTYVTERPNSGILETFKSPFKSDQNATVDITFPEFSSLCLDGETLIDVCTDEIKHPHGIPLKELVDTSGLLYSFDLETQRPVVRPYHSVRLTGFNSECVEVKMEMWRIKGPNDRYYENQSIFCTPTHPFLVRTGWGRYQWIQAGKLKKGMSLVADQRSDETLRSESRHRMAMACIQNRDLLKEEHVHHIDENHHNNTPSNLELKLNTLHLSDHKIKKYGYTEILDIEDLIKQYESGENFNTLAKKYGCDGGTIYDRIAPYVKLRSQSESLSLRHRVENEGKWHEARRLYELGYTIYEVGAYFKVHGTSILEWIKRAGGKTREANATRHSKKREVLPSLNHRILDVVPATSRDVYNLEVEKTECFFGNGVVLHNCPKTGQPDFATIVIEYCPRELCVESKSLKLYFFAWRQEGCFMEEITERIKNDLVEVLNPWWLRVQGQFNPRGATTLWPHVVWYHPEWEFKT